VRVLAIDLGDARTGLALGDRITNIAAPAALIETPVAREHGNALLREIARQAASILGGPREMEQATILIGLPLNMDDTEGPRAKSVRSFAARVASELAHPVLLVDERRSTIAADARMAQSGLTHKQKKLRRDAIAAATICQAYLDDPSCVLGTIEPAPPPAGTTG
jgi:putative Holliday junction resolvase